MPTLEVEESDFAGYIPDDEMRAGKVLNVKLEEKPYVDKETGQKVKKMVFIVEVDDPINSDQNGNKVYGETGTKLNTHPNCKLRNWASAILGLDLPAGYRLDTDDLIGLPCRILVGLREYEKDGSTKQTNFIKEVFPSEEALERLAASKADEPF